MDGRIRLRQWLEGRLNTGYIPGLVWLDKSKGIFKIPWKHHSKHTWQEDDAAIFKDWAVVTGRYREGLDVPDWPMWKTRLRCALNKAPDIQEVRQHHNLHCDEPFKVYRFISKTESMWRANATRHASLIFDGVPPQQTHINTNIPQFFSANSSQCIIRSSGNHSHNHHSNNNNNSHCHTKKISLSKPITLIQKTEQGHIKLKYINIPIHSRSTSTSLSHSATNNQSPCSPGPPGTDCKPASAHGHGYSPSKSALSLSVSTNKHNSNSNHNNGNNNNINSNINISNNNNNNNNNNVNSNNINSKVVTAMYVPAGGVGGGGQAIVDTKLKLTDVMEPEMHQICLRIQHLDHRVSDMIVNNPNGCCVYFGRFDENLSTAGPEPIEPQIYQYVSDSNKYCVDMLLDNMQRGVVLTISNGSIYAEKLCKCATFIYRPGNNGEFYFIDKLNRRDKMMIFDFRTFLEELHYFQRGLGDKPHVELILAFGQQIKENSSPESLYVWCRLASCKAWFLLQRAISNQSKQPSQLLGNSNKKSCANSIISMQSTPIESILQSIPNGIIDQTEEVVTEDLIEENVIDHMVYGENCLSDELGIGVGQEVSIENVSEEFPSINFQSSFGSRSRFEESDLNYQFENSSNYEFK